MENGPFIGDLPIKIVISIAMFSYQRVIIRMPTNMSNNYWDYQTMISSYEQRLKRLLVDD